MQIIIPMSGIGKRFLNSDYKMPKPLIKIDGKPMIHHVIDMFPGEKDFTFICNEHHLKNKDYSMENIIRSKINNAKIISIKPHKLGPVYAVSKVLKIVKDKEPVIINYCDFSCYWNYKFFKNIMLKGQFDGCIPAYRNFHPHSLWQNNYAFIKEENLLVKDIKEKSPFTDNSIKEFASSGTYYFKSGDLMKKSIQYCFDNKLTVNKEYYVSLAYKYLLNKNKKVFVYELEHFMQWGTPNDLNEYLKWSKTFRDYPKIKQEKKTISNHAIIMPMAGSGQRFQEQGYGVCKPLIKVKGKPMFKAVLDDLHKASIYVFVLRKNMKNFYETLNCISEYYPKSIIKILDKDSNGQAISCLKGVEALEKNFPNFKGSITFTSCDTGFIYKKNKFRDLLKSRNSDIIVWGAKNHPTAIRFPNMFGWIKSKKTNVIDFVNVKKPLNNPKTDPLITGTFTFKNINIFRRSVKRLINRNEKVNGEFYLDSAINDAISLGFFCKLFIVDHQISWGTPNDLETFNYWQDCFSKWKSHKFRGF